MHVRPYKIAILASSSAFVLLWLITFPLTIFLTILLFPFVAFGGFLYWGYWRRVLNKALPIGVRTFWCLSAGLHSLGVLCVLGSFLQNFVYDSTVWQDRPSIVMFSLLYAVPIVGLVCSIRGIYDDVA